MKIITVLLYISLLSCIAFSQEQEGTNRTFEGNGLGLALAKKYCDLNSFKIELKSTKNTGTTVVIAIPIE